LIDSIDQQTKTLLDFAAILERDIDHSCSARAKHTLFLTKSARTLTHFIMRTHFTFF